MLGRDAIMHPYVKSGLRNGTYERVHGPRYGVRPNLRRNLDICRLCRREPSALRPGSEERQEEAQIFAASITSSDSAPGASVGSTVRLSAASDSHDKNCFMFVTYVRNGCCSNAFAVRLHYSSTASLGTARRSAHVLYPA